MPGRVLILHRAAVDRLRGMAHALDAGRIHLTAAPRAARVRRTLHLPTGTEPRRAVVTATLPGASHLEARARDVPRAHGRRQPRGARGKVRLVPDRLRLVRLVRKEGRDLSS